LFAQSKTTSKKTSEPERRKGGSMTKVYILEDDSLLGPTMKDLVEISGEHFETKLFVYFSDFMAAVKNSPPDATIVDLNVPDKSGASIVSELSVAFSRGPVFVYSGDYEALEAVSALALPRVSTSYKTDSFDTVIGWLEGLAA
jgi:DNA-binding NtrC family response regulator